MDITNQSIAAKLISKLSPPKSLRAGGSSPTQSGLVPSAKSNSYDALSDRQTQPGWYMIALAPSL